MAQRYDNNDTIGFDRVLTGLVIGINPEGSTPLFDMNALCALLVCGKEGRRGFILDLNCNYYVFGQLWVVSSGRLNFERWSRELNFCYHRNSVLLLIILRSPEAKRLCI